MQVRAIYCMVSSFSGLQLEDLSTAEVERLERVRIEGLAGLGGGLGGFGGWVLVDEFAYSTSLVSSSSLHRQFNKF
jgi:hypothetical protein